MTLAKFKDLFSVIISLGTSRTLSAQRCKAIASCSSPTPALSSLFFFGFLSLEDSNPSSFISGHRSSLSLAHLSSFIFKVFRSLSWSSIFSILLSSEVIFKFMASTMTSLRIMLTFISKILNHFPRSRAEFQLASPVLTEHLRLNQFQT